MSDFVIEDGIPVPKVVGKSRYPWSGMKMGQSFFVAEVDKKKANSIKASGKRFFDKHEDGIYTVVAAPEADGYRFWKSAKGGNSGSPLEGVEV